MLIQPIKIGLKKFGDITLCHSHSLNFNLQLVVLKDQLSKHKKKIELAKTEFQLTHNNMVTFICTLASKQKRYLTHVI